MRGDIYRNIFSQYRSSNDVTTSSDFYFERTVTADRCGGLTFRERKKMDTRSEAWGSGDHFQQEVQQLPVWNVVHSSVQKKKKKKEEK